MDLTPQTNTYCNLEKTEGAQRSPLSGMSGSTSDQQCDRCNRKNKMSWHLIAETNEWICSWCYGKFVRTSRIDRKLRKASQGK